MKRACFKSCTFLHPAIVYTNPVFARKPEPDIRCIPTLFYSPFSPTLCYFLKAYLVNKLLVYKINMYWINSTRILYTWIADFCMTFLRHSSTRRSSNFGNVGAQWLMCGCIEPLEWGINRSLGSNPSLLPPPRRGSIQYKNHPARQKKILKMADNAVL